VKTILVFTKNWLGDVIFETPAIKAIKDNYPESRLICATPPRCVEILRANPHVDEVIPFDERTTHRAFWQQLSFVKELRTRKIDAAFLFHRSLTRAFLTLLGGAKERVGYADKGRSLFLTRAVPSNYKGKHHVHMFLDLLREAGLRVDTDPYCSFYFSAQDASKAERLLERPQGDAKKWVALNPGGNRDNKRWPVEYFAELADAVTAKKEYAFVITGHATDQALANGIMQRAQRADLRSVCGQTNLGELGAVFARCEFVISGDSGPVHIAAGVGADVVALFGPTDPRDTGPMGPRKNLVIEAETRDDHAMKTIRPERVLAVLRRESWL